MVLPRFLLGWLWTLMIPAFALAQLAGFNYDEAKVPPYTLPDPLVFADGQPVTSARDWVDKRRPELFRLFEEQVYGRSPAPRQPLEYQLVSQDDQALSGTAIRKQITAYFSDRKDGPRMDILIYLPRDAKKPVPMFLGMNFRGNHTVHHDPGIRITESWVPNDDKLGYVNNRAREKSRGGSDNRWAIERILERGYGLATIYCGDVEPDHPDGFRTGLRSIYLPEGKAEFAPDEWGCIAAWAWGLSRALDYFEKDDQIDARRVAVMGHSRLGKTSLWAGAADPRFAIVISNNSGCGGAALSKRIFGETVGRINKSFPHWFCGNYKKYSDHEADLPVDQHELIALIAPRPVYVASAEQDLWADPRGEFLAALHASPVYELLGCQGLPAKEMPAVNQPVMGTIGYHVRTGVHDVTDYDWERYMDFADKHFGR